MDRVEQIIGYVKEYEEKVREEKRITKEIDSVQEDIDNMMDTGNMHLLIKFNHGDGYEPLYREGTYPSEKVRYAIKEDMEKYKLSLQEELRKIHSDVLRLRCLISGR